jgi:hypothetical protein
MDISLQKLMVVSLQNEFNHLSGSRSKQLFQVHYKKKAPSQCATGQKPGFYLYVQIIY